MKNYIACFLLAASLAACGGVPLRSIPRLISLQSQLLELEPAEVMLAIQVDARMVPPPGAAPVLLFAIRPSEAGAFEPVDKRLPMEFTVTSERLLGLAPARANRRWLIYSLPPESQTELASVQSTFKRIQAERHGKRGGAVAIGIAQEGVAVRNPIFANTRWESWLQTSRRDGMFELWSGTVAALLKQAEASHPIK